MRYASVNSKQGKFFVARFLAKGDDSGFQTLGAAQGFDTDEDAVAFLDNYKPQRLDETILLIEVVEDRRVVSRLWRAEPVKPRISAVPVKDK